ncbi:MAG TPA: protein translocase subunit SecF [Candidatus Magasanikbacteria bacterium]|nr:protein translocase subunit SecF [Candidatus Magasanikbacteria bacterium]
MIQIIKYKKYPFIFSGVLTVASIIAILVFGLRPGMDFTGGSLIEVSFTGSRPTAAEVRSSLEEIDLGTVVAQPVGDQGMIVKTRFISEDEHQLVLVELRKDFAKGSEQVLESRVETIGPAISSNLKDRAVASVIAVSICIVLYIAYTFRKVSRPMKSWQYGVTAIVALLHDILITVGVFAVLGKYMGVEVDVPFVVALLTILGYSINDTIIVFDRIRENLTIEGTDNFSRTVNAGINQTIARSLNTSGTTLLTLFALFIFGGATIKFFSLALIIGVAFGTYSSVFVASALLVAWHEWRMKRAARE